MADRNVEGFPVDLVEVGRLFPADRGPAVGLVFSQADRPGQLVFILGDGVAFNTAALIFRLLNVTPAYLAEVFGDEWPTTDGGAE